MRSITFWAHRRRSNARRKTSVSCRHTGPERHRFLAELNVREDGENPSLPRNCKRPLVTALSLHRNKPVWEGNSTILMGRKSGDRFSAQMGTLFRGGKTMAVLSFLIFLSANVFVVESPSYAKEMVAAAHDLSTRYPELRFTIRTTEQVAKMPREELRRSFDEASVVVLGRTYGDVAAKIQESLAPIRGPQVVFAAHSDFGIYELNRYGNDRPFRNVSPDQIDRISAGTLPAGEIPELRRWARSFEYLVAKGPENFRNLFLDLLSNLDSRYRAGPVRLPPAAFIYRDASIYSDPAAFASHIEPGRPTV